MDNRGKTVACVTGSMSFLEQKPRFVDLIPRYNPLYYTSAVVVAATALLFKTTKNRDVSTGPFAHPFACTIDSFACSALLTLLACSAALICLLLRSLTHSRTPGKVNVKMLGQQAVLCFGP